MHTVEISKARDLCSNELIKKNIKLKIDSLLRALLCKETKR